MTTKHVVANDALGKITKRWWEVIRRVMEGTLDPDVVADSLQRIVEGKLLPSEMTIAGRTYEIFGFLRGDEKSVVGHTIVERAKEMKAPLGQDDGQHLLDHQEEIPEALRGKVFFVFPNWRNSHRPECVACVFWFGGRWLLSWNWLDVVFDVTIGCSAASPVNSNFR